MSVEKFKILKITCDDTEVIGKISSLESEWLKSLLQRAGIPKEIIDKVEGGSLSPEEWRSLLMKKNGLIVSKNLKTSSVDVTKIDRKNGEYIELGKWFFPEINRIKKNNRKICEINLKYWDLL